MWHMTFKNGAKPCYEDLLHLARARDHAFRVQNSTSDSSRPLKPVPGESLLSPSVSVDYSNLLTKPEVILETPRDPNWKFNSGRLTTSMFVPNSSYSSNGPQSVQKFNLQTNLQSPVIKPHPQTQWSKSKKSDSCQVYDNII